MKRDDAVHKSLEHHRELSERYGIASLFLLGSVAHDEARADSDVDFG
jgi:predicted nucleotidyltransferase